ncbi:MAG: ATP-binding protein [Ruminococcus sp.]|nr:ATP-binding protein [Ruminococcus sp.]MCM1380626.1 ATP-binding protein [Muribaculaceae bacterium]MCM1478368.1 ATP-binding protein [Muribaculaceae bacterium]
MEISEIIETLTGTSPRQGSQSYFEFDRAYYEKRCRALNETVGTLNADDGINCERCRNKSYIYTLSEDLEILSGECPDCFKARNSMRLLKISGLENKSFDNFYAKNDWQKGILDKAKKFAADTGAKWLFIGGQSGCGKTHLCTAALREKILTQNRSVRVMKWVESARLLKAAVNGAEYDSVLNRFKGAEILYIDDLFKGGGKAVSSGDLRLAFELLDYRYLKNLATVISSECSLEKIFAEDEAVGGRIREKAGEYVLHIARDGGKNYRA